LELSAKSQVSAQIYLACTCAWRVYLRPPQLVQQLSADSGRVTCVPISPEPIFRVRVKKGPENRISLVSGYCGGTRG